MLKIAGNTMPSPSQMDVALFSVGSASKRNAAGSAVIDRLAVKRRLRIRWNMLTQSELTAVMNATAPVFFTVTYPDPVVGAQTITCCCQERGGGILRVIDNVAQWKNVEITCIER